MTKSLLLVVLMTSSVCAVSASSVHDGNAPVMASPAIPGLATSDLYTVTVNGTNIWTEQIRTALDIGKLPDWFIEPYTKVQQEIHQASLSCDGQMQVSILVSRAFKEVTIHPTSRGIQRSVKDNTVTFVLTGPSKIYVVIDSLPPLCLFIDSLERGNILADTSGTQYFGPGVHRPGYVTLHDNETMYIAAGAIVYGGIRANGVKHIRVLGRGILDGGGACKQMVLLENCQDVLFEGIMIRNGDGWTNTLSNCDDIRYRAVKILSFGPAGDGIDVLGSRHVVLSHCFVRSTDDCIAMKAPDPRYVVDDVLVANSTMVGYAFADGVTIGFETNAPSMRNIIVRNCDVILARGGSRVDGHSGFSIICDGPAMIENVLFENIRVEESELKLFELQITDGTKYGVGPPGHIQNITVKNVSWAHAKPILLKGFDEAHKVRKVVFDHCTVAGSPLRDRKARVMHIGTFVEDVEVR